MFWIVIQLEPSLKWHLFFSIRQRHFLFYVQILKTIHNSIDLMNWPNPLSREAAPDHMLPPPCLTVPVKYLGFNPFGLRTRLIPSESFKINMDSTENSTVFHFWSLQLRWALPNSILDFLFFDDMKGFLLIVD